MGQPLAGIKVVVTRAEGPGGPLTARLEARGATVVHWPVIRIDPPEDPQPLTDAMRRLSEYDWVVFTSARAVTAVAARISWPEAGPKVAAVGPGTATALAAVGWPVDLTASEGGAALVEALAAAGCAGARVLFPASDVARPTVAEGLRRLGATVDQVPAYRTRPEALERDACLAQLREGGIVAITFASPSAVESLERALGAGAFGLVMAAVSAVAIGPTTADALDRLGHPADAVAADATLDGLAAAVERVVAHR